MSDDLFSRLFELFNQPGPVNWKLAEEVARHLAGDPEPVEPWAAEEQRELVSLAEYRLEPETPFPVAPAAEVLVVDSPRWVELALRRFGYLAEAIAESGASGGAAQAIPGMAATLAGMQVGSLVGSVSRQVAASFETGLPMDPPGPLLVIQPGVERVIAGMPASPRDVRLWVATEEVAHRALFGVSWLPEHLGHLFAAYTSHLLPDPGKLMQLWTENTEGAARFAEGGSLEDLFANEEAVPHRRALEAFIAVTSGYRHFLARRAVGNLLPAIDTYRSPAPEEVAGLAPPLGRHELTMTGAQFCEEIDRRYGREALDGLWHGPERLPTIAELTDPVGWAARVLLADPFL